MPTLEDLNVGGSGPKIPWAKLQDKGDFVKGVIVDIDLKRPVWNPKAKLPMFWVDGKPTPHDRDDAKKAGLKPVTQIVFVLETSQGQQQVGFNSKLEREALRAAVEAAGGEFNVGDTLGKKHIGKVENSYNYEVKLIPAGD